MQYSDIEKIKDEQIEIYTDGGCYPNPGSGAWTYLVVINGKLIDECWQYHQITTNNEMELMAIREAMLWAVGNTENCDITIYSDSQYAINCITVWYDSWVRNGKLNKMKNIPLISKIMNIYNRTGRQYELKWVKGHSSDRFNNLADQKVKRIIFQRSGI